MPLVDCDVCEIGFPAEEIDGHRERMHPEEVKRGDTDLPAVQRPVADNPSES